MRVTGGGHTSQIYAIRQAISKSIVAYYQKFVDEHSKNQLKQLLIAYDRSLLVADNRRCEPKKFGGPGARARYQSMFPRDGRAGARADVVDRILPLRRLRRVSFGVFYTLLGLGWWGALECCGKSHVCCYYYCHKMKARYRRLVGGGDKKNYTNIFSHTFWSVIYVILSGGLALDTPDSEDKIPIEAPYGVPAGVYMPRKAAE